MLQIYYCPETENVTHITLLFSIFLDKKNAKQREKLCLQRYGLSEGVEIVIVIKSRSGLPSGIRFCHFFWGLAAADVAGLLDQSQGVLLAVGGGEDEEVGPAGISGEVEGVGVIT
jgi:hypothetical protein